MLEILQNTSELRFQLGAETLDLLRTEFNLPKKWQRTIEEMGDREFAPGSLTELFDGWFGQGNRQLRTAIEQAAAIVYYRHQTSVPVIETIVCDDAGQFKLLTERLTLCCPFSEKLMRSVITKNYRRWCLVMENCLIHLPSVIETITSCFSITVMARLTRWRKPYEKNSTNCFQPKPATMRSTNALQRRQRKKTSC